MAQADDDDARLRSCSLCDGNWSEHSVAVFKCILCNDGSYWCIEDGDRKHTRKDHSFEPDYADNPYVKDMMKSGQNVICEANQYKYSQHLNNAASNVSKFVSHGAAALANAQEASGFANAVVDTVLSVISPENIDKVANMPDFGQAVEVATESLIANQSLDKVMDQVIGNAANAAFVVATIQTAFNTYQLVRGDISWKEFGRRSVKTVATGYASLTGNSLGFGSGAQVGFLIGGPAGAFWGSLIGSIGGAVLAGTATNALFDKIWPEFNNAKDEYDKMLDAALDMFGIDKKNLQNKKLFNLQVVKKKYKLLAKVHHPDSGGKHESFIALNSNFGLLSALCEGKVNLKKEMKEQKESDSQRKAISG